MLGVVCLAHHGEHARLVPIEMHHVRPVARGGQGSLTVPLCANAHGEVHDLLDEIEARALTSPFALVDEVIRNIPREVRAVYSPRVRVIAYRGWQTYGLGFLGGRYANDHRHWRTDGTAKAEGVPAFNETMHAARWSRRWRRNLERT